MFKELQELLRSKLKINSFENRLKNKLKNGDLRINRLNKDSQN
jgi:hypothetical protein